MPKVTVLEEGDTSDNFYFCLEKPGFKMLLKEAGRAK